MFDNLPLEPPIEPMEARAVKTIPAGEHWLYEPKWDGFRCVAFRDGADVALQSKAGQPLERYFPELVDAVKALPVKQFILDGEIAIEADGALDFDALLQRIHPAASRITRLAKETPAKYFVFDLLAAQKSAYFDRPLEDRRESLETFAAKNFAAGVLLSPASLSEQHAQEWLAGTGAFFDGVMAKRIDAPYAFGSRDMAVKIKRLRTADCVVGGFRLSKDGKTIGSLLLGLYDKEGLLHHVGFVGSLQASERKRAYELLRPLQQEPGFTGSRPGGPSRWRRGEEAPWYPVAPNVVVEVQYDHTTGHRFRHGARFLRWRPDKAPRQCTMDQAFAD